ncbi:orotidine-5'-phosphate decarboxylase [bacterium]|nr:MAG: orotidine-5'-phosphate decarboxylase [bacterium]RKZ17666.1 MAG: orotidine-5'-phosphate decarboxylase [bacterium]
MSLTRREDDPRRRLILALDLPDGDQALRLADQLRPELAWVKVGLQLFGAAGPDVVRKLVSLGLNVFVDLKLHDIPNTMARAAESLCGLGTSMLTTHAAAGEQALRETAGAVAAAPDRSGKGKPIVLAVTVLTSFSAEGYSGVVGRDAQPSLEVPRLGRLAIDAGVDGLVASPMEVRALREELGPNPVLVIPGIRPAGSATDDQARVATPAAALRDGADYLVVGRPIARAEQPRDALLRILDEMASAS